MKLYVQWSCVGIGGIKAMLHKRFFAGLVLTIQQLLWKGFRLPVACTGLTLVGDVLVQFDTHFGHAVARLNSYTSKSRQNCNLAIAATQCQTHQMIHTPLKGR